MLWNSTCITWRPWGLRALVILVAITCLVSTSALAQAQPPADEATPQETPPTPSEELAKEQDQLATKYQRLEDLLFKMADFEATTNPRRAALAASL